jgi:hypothetical protein
MRHFKGSKEELAALMKEETYLTAEELADKFNNVTVMKQELEAVAMDFGEDIDELGDIEAFAGVDLEDEEHLSPEQEGLLAKFQSFLNKSSVRQAVKHQPKEVDMPITPEERAELVRDVTASVVDGLKEVLSQTQPPAPVEEAPETPEIAFEGDPSKQEDVDAHLAKLKEQQLLASVDWSDPASVAAYQKAAFGASAQEAPAASNTEPEAGVRGSFSSEKVTDAEAKSKAGDLIARRKGDK